MLEVLFIFEVLGTAMRLGPGSREAGAGGLTEEDGPNGFFAGLVVVDAVRVRTLWGPRVFGAGAGAIDVGAVRSGLSLASTRTLRGPHVDFPTIFGTATTGLERLPIVDGWREGGRTMLVCWVATFERRLEGGTGILMGGFDKGAAGWELGMKGLDARDGRWMNPTGFFMIFKVVLVDLSSGRSDSGSEKSRVVPTKQTLG